MDDTTNSGANPFDPNNSGMPMPPQNSGSGNPASEEDTTPANFQLGTLFTEELTVKLPESNLQYDSVYFTGLLAGSISLSREEKKRIIDSIPRLRQEQIDELTRIFEEEKLKFSMLSKKHVPQLEKLAEQHYREWMDIEAEFQQKERQHEEQSQADEIRKQLGL
jgi:hypothetical protein